MLLDLRSIDHGGAPLNGKVAEEALEAAGIAVNKNLIPYDPQPPAVTSGIRVGTPAVTTRGMGPDEMVQIAQLMGRVLHAPEDVDALGEVHAEVHALCERFPVPILGART
jgi:glycine hydroxymethyltransferase